MRLEYGGIYPKKGPEKSLLCWEIQRDKEMKFRCLVKLFI